MIKTIIFDLDGTLVNTIGGIAWACNYVLEQHHYKTRRAEDYNELVGNGLQMTIFKALPEEANISLESEVLKELVEEFLEYYSENPMVDTKVYTGIYAMLEVLKTRGIRWGIHTNKQHNIATKIVEELFGNNEYIGIQGFSDRVKHKPNTSGTLLLIGDNYVAGDILYVGDTEVDYETAVNLGVQSVLTSWGYRKRSQLEQLKPNFIIDSPQDLIKIIDKLNKTN